LCTGEIKYIHWNVQQKGLRRGNGYTDIGQGIRAKVDKGTNSRDDST